MNLRILSLLVPLVMVLPSLAYADDPPLVDAGELARADTLFRDANEAYRAKDFAKARSLYLEAFGIKKTFDIAGHLGKAELQLGLYRDAAEHLAACIRLAPPNQGKEIFEPVIKDLEQAKAQIATVLVKAPEGATISIDGHDVGIAPLDRELFVETGRRRIEASLNGKTVTDERDLAKGTTTEVTLTIAADPDIPKPPGTEPLPSWPGWLLGGVGLAAGVGGAVLVGLGQASLTEGEDLGTSIDGQGGSCEPIGGPGSAQCAEARDSLDTAGTLTGAGIGLLAAGGAFLVGGVIYLAIPKAGASNEARLLPIIAPDAAGLLLQGAF